MNRIEMWNFQIQQSLAAMGGNNRFFIASLILTLLTVLALAVSITLKFMEEPAQDKRIEQFCPVSTLTMSLFFIAFMPLIRFRIGVHDMDSITGGTYFLAGALLAVGSTLFNIYARSHIREFWSDQIVMRQEHHIVMDGPYAFVRHPMYASLILYGLGLSMMFQNYAMLLMTLFVFVPLMFYRAGAEEKQLEGLGAPQYRDYRKKTPFLIPILEKRLQWAVRWLGIAFFVATLIRNKFGFEEILFLSLYYWLIAYFVDIPKVRFSYRMKAFALLVVYIVSLKIPNAFYFYYLLFSFAIIGMKYNCPAMMMYLMFNPPKEEPHA